MADFPFNTEAGATVERELLIAYLNTGTTSSPVWSPIGSRVNDSSEEFDWGEETNIDILGVSHTDFKKPVISQTFDPLNLVGGDAAVQKIWNLAVKEQNYSALSNQDMLIVHFYANAGTEQAPANFAERYASCAIKPSSLGGAGGSIIGMPIDVTYGGERTLGTASVSNAGVVTFTADSGSSSGVG